MAIEDQVEQFLRRELTKMRPTTGPIIGITVRHAAAGSKGNDVTTIDLEGRDVNDDTPSQYADEILNYAQTDADGNGGVNRYIIQLFVKGSDRSVAKLPIRVRGVTDDFDEGAGEDSATSKGLLSQLMRHNEAIMRTAIQSVSGLTHTMSRQMEKQAEVIEKLSSYKEESALRLEEASSQSHMRDMELMKENRKSEREDKLFDKISVLMPALINRMTGQKVFNAEDPMIMMLKGFTDSMTQEQFRAIQGNLNAEQQILLGQIIMTAKGAKITPKLGNGVEEAKKD